MGENRRHKNEVSYSLNICSGIWAMLYHQQLLPRYIIR